jgi:hypothetical protein
MLVAFEVVEIGLIKKCCLHTELCQEEIVFIDALIIDLDIFVNLNSIFSVLYGLIVFS